MRESASFNLLTNLRKSQITSIMKNINLLKKSFTAITLLFCTFYLHGQINEQLTTKPWLDNEERIIFGHTITQIFGESPGRAATYNFSQITSIAYQDLDQIITEIKETAKKENWGEEKLNEEIDKKIEEPFYVYVDDKQSDQLSDFKFLVEKE